VLPDDPQRTVAAGAAAAIPLLVGANRDEAQLFQVLGGDSFRPAGVADLHTEMLRAGVADPDGLLCAYRNRVGDSDLSTLRAAFLTDAIYRVPAARLAEAQVRAGGRAHHYLFLDEPCGPAMGAFHGADLLYTFDKLSLIGADTPDRIAVRDTLLRAWASFAETGGPGWPMYDADSAGNSRVIGGSAEPADGMATEPPFDDVTTLGRAG
jgi:para-nitrobenzyl esterase